MACGHVTPIVVSGTGATTALTCCSGAASTPADPRAIPGVMAFTPHNSIGVDGLSQSGVFLKGVPPASTPVGPPPLTPSPVPVPFVSQFIDAPVFVANPTSTARGATQPSTVPWTPTGQYPANLVSN